MVPPTPNMTFTPRKGYRQSAIAMLPGFVANSVASASMMWIDGPKDRRVLGVFFFSIFWGAWASLSLWMLLISVRMRLHIEQGRIIRQGVMTSAEIDLPNIGAARWRISNKGGITLIASTCRLIIDFDVFEPVERLWLIRFFRTQLPKTAQKRWGPFCQAMALPLRDRLSATTRPLTVDRIAITRRRWDWYFVPSILLCSAFGVVLYWRLRNPETLVQPLVLVPLWLCLRFTTPRQGLICGRIEAEPGAKRFFILVFLWLACGIAGIFFLERLRLPKPQGIAAGSAAALIWLGVLLWQVHVHDRQRLKHALAKYEDAIRRWDETEPEK